MGRFAKSKIKKILFVSYSNIGDAVLSLPVLERLRSFFPQARIDVVHGIRSRVVFEYDPRVHKRFVYDRRKPWKERIRFFYGLWRTRYDLVVDLRGSLFGFLGRRRTPFFRWPHPIHMRDRHLSMLSGLGIPLEQPNGILPPSEGVRLSMNDALRSIGGRFDSRLIVIAPGSRSPLKQWGEENYARLADRLVGHLGVHIAWVGEKSEEPIIRRICQQMQFPSTDLVGKTSWDECVYVIGQSSLVITNDSAPTHAADQLGKKVMVFFGPTDPAKYGPQGSPDGVLFRKKFCSPCEKPFCRYKHECMKEITVDEAYKRAVALLNNDGGRAEKRILFVRLDRIGDVLLSLPAIHAVRRRFPKAKLTAMVRPYAQSIVERSEDVDDVMVYDYRDRAGQHRFPLGYFRLLHEIRKRKFDMVFVLHPTLRSHVLCFLAGIPRRVGYAVRGNWLLTETTPDRRHLGTQHESDNVLDLVKPFALHDGPKRLKFSLHPEDSREAKEALASEGMGSNERYFVFHPGTSHRSKQWPRERFLRLGHLLQETWGYGIVLVGDGRHTALNRWICDAMGGRCLDLSGRTSVVRLAAVLSGCEILVSNDSGPVHLAVAVERPVISIFGRSEPGLGPGRWGPLGENCRAIQKDVGCVVCLADKCTIDFECLKAVWPEEVFDAVRSLLGEPNAARSAESVYGCQPAFFK